MASHSNVRHRRAAAAAAQRRAPNPQLGFNPTAVFTDPGDVGPTGIFGGLSDFCEHPPILRLVWECILTGLLSITSPTEANLDFR